MMVHALSKQHFITAFHPCPVTHSPGSSTPQGLVHMMVQAVMPASSVLSRSFWYTNINNSLVSGKPQPATPHNSPAPCRVTHSPGYQHPAATQHKIVFT
jgi:hypothetical protein